MSNSTAIYRETTSQYKNYVDTFFLFKKHLQSFIRNNK